MENGHASLHSSTEKSLKVKTLRFTDPTGVQHYIQLFQVSGVFIASKGAGAPEIAAGFRLLKG